MEQSQSWGDIMEKEIGDEEVGAGEFKYPMQGANRWNRRQNNNKQRPTQPEGQTFHRRREEAYGQHHWQTQNGPDRSLPQRRPPQWQVVADLRKELEGVKVLLKQERDLSKAGRERYTISKSKIQEVEERLRVEQEERLQCDQEIRMLKQKLQETTCSEPKQQETLQSEKDALLEKIKIMQKETFSKDIKTAKQTMALKYQLEEVTLSRQNLFSKLEEQEEANLGLQKELRDSKKKRQHHKMMADNLRREMEEVRLQHLERANKDLMLVERLTEEKESLEQEVKVFKEEVEEISCALQKEVEELQKDKEHHTLRADCLQKELEEVSQLCTTSEEITSWRKAEKICTSESRQRRQLVSKLERQEEMIYSLKKKVEELQKDKENQKLRADRLQEELEEDSPPCPTREDITMLRMAEKICASESRRHQYKRQRRQNLDPK
ncbi:golgin subfamily A member 6-like protein 1 [Labrus bergylta]|uniref:golgin subfamily A member 6-like protein 1 n=1 Tax=Labrus bergylta TaxID=56723 RepID=UPI0033135A1A